MVVPFNSKTSPTPNPPPSRGPSYEEWERAAAQATPAGLAHLASNRRFKMPAHIALLDQKLFDLATGQIKHLLINMPPRHGKSEICSKYFPAWCVARLHKRVILSSYEATFAASWGRKARDIVDLWGMPIFGARLSHASSAADWWELTGNDGAMMTAGVGGPVTGKGGDILIVDDPTKNAEEARSVTMREKMWDWWISTFYPRGEPNASYLVIQTRWNEDDLTGRLLALEADGGEHWEHVTLPALAEQDEHLDLDGGDVFERHVGEALWPERYDVDALQKRKKALGSYWFAALFQQRPAPEAGEKFKRHWFKYWTYEADGQIFKLGSDKHVPVSECWYFGTMDLAASEKESADYTVIGIYAVTPDTELLLIDIIRAQVSAAEHDEMIESVFARFPLAFLGIESVQYQLALIQRMVGAGYPIRKLKADRDKVSRALVASARYEVGMNYHKANASWLDDFETELLLFPNGKKDDQVDVAGYASIALIPDSDDVNLAPIAPRFLAGHAKGRS